MYVVWHNLQGENVAIKLRSLLLQKCAQIVFHLVNQDFSAPFWTPDEVIVEQGN